MPIKRQPSEAELNTLADRFRALWREGDPVRPWLRKHHAMIRSLIGDEWSWAAVADALTRAGITWRTGRPWSAEGLRRTVYRAAVPLKRRPSGAAPVPAAPLPTLAEAATAASAYEAPRYAFQPARPKPQELPVPLTPEQERECAAQRKRLFG